MIRPVRIVLDTNVIISALISDGPPRAIVKLCRSGEVQLVTSGVIIAELSEVLRRKFHWGAPRVETLLQELRSFALVVVPAEAVHRIPDDPADDRVLECALEGGVDTIVSGDSRHLQPLGSFCGIPILSPIAFLRATGALP